MRQYSDSITLIKNKRGVWDLDVSKGCGSGVKENINGCYGDCYACRSANRYGMDFSKTVLRCFMNEKHIYNIIDKITYIDMPFVRIGVTGDPSECWEHTLNVCDIVSRCNMVLHETYRKCIVIITKHWNNLTKQQLDKLAKFDVCVNTSVSALDNDRLLNNRIAQYYRLKEKCKSILRIVSCDFNINNETGRKLDKLQNRLFLIGNCIDTVFRPNANNILILNNIINVDMAKFLHKPVLASMKNKNAYLGYCDSCPDMCGINFS